MTPSAPTKPRALVRELTDIVDPDFRRRCGVTKNCTAISVMAYSARIWRAWWAIEFAGPRDVSPWRDVNWGYGNSDWTAEISVPAMKWTQRICDDPGERVLPAPSNHVE